MTRGGQGGHCAQVGCAYVLDAAEWRRLRTAGSQARQPGRHPGGRKHTVIVIGRALLSRAIASIGTACAANLTPQRPEQREPTTRQWAM
jgi:hypothetical protein